MLKCGSYSKRALKCNAVRPLLQLEGHICSPACAPSLVRRLEWVLFLFEVNKQRLKESSWTDITICSEHFTDDCFVSLALSGSVQLKPGAVPSLWTMAPALQLCLRRSLLAMKKANLQTMKRKAIEVG
uniref:THAP-type domain-containing protein n=1 Tax=Neolamprologus brichardi TaxID=32507 RepID=A0A3Q4MVY5_NEOBR